MTVGLIAVLLVGAIGLYTGYSVLGNQPAFGAFRLSSWQHLIELIFSE
jgi:hypothetical protein